MVDNIYRLTDVSPVKTGDVVQLGDNKYRILELEPLYFEFRNVVGGIDLGFNTQIYPIPNIIPSKDFIHYITGFALYGRFEAQLKYQAGQPRNAVGAISTQRLNRFQAWLTRPFTFKFAILSGDTLEADILPAFAGVKGAIWFYGWKFRVGIVTDPNVPAMQIEDVRRK